MYCLKLIEYYFVFMYFILVVFLKAVYFLFQLLDRCVLSVQVTASNLLFVSFLLFSMHLLRVLMLIDLLTHLKFN